VTRGQRAALGALVAGIALLLFAEGAALSTAWLPIEEAPALQHARDGGNAHWAGGYLYPAVLAPVARSLSPVGAHRFAQILSAVLWALVAVPAYFVARRLVSHRAALVVAALSALVPGAVYATAAVPDALALLLAVWSLSLLLRGSDRGSRRDLLGAIVVAAAAALARPWFVLLPPALLVAYELPRRETRSSFLRWPRSLVFAGLAVFAYLVLAATAPDAGNALTSPGSTARAAAASLAVVVVGCGVVPWLLAASASRTPVSMLLAACLPALVITAGMFGAAGDGVDERPLLALVPLVLTLAAAAWLRGTVRFRAAVTVAVLAALAAIALPGLGRPAVAHAAGLSLIAPHGASRAVLVLGVAAALAVALGILRMAPRRSLVLPVLVAVVIVASEAVAWASVRSEARTLAAVEPRPRDWVDRHVRPGTHVLVVGPAGELDARTLAQLTLWNRAVRGAQVLDLSNVNPATPLLPLAKSDLLARGVELSGTVLARSRAGTLMHSPLPVQLAQTLDGMYADGWSTGYVTYRRFSGSSKPGRVVVTVSRAGWGGADRPGHVSVFVGRLGGNATTQATDVIHSGQTNTLTVHVPAPPFQVVVSTTPTFSPSQFGASDTRQLGAQLKFDYRPNP
jgi:hypothetical protein